MFENRCHAPGLPPRGLWCTQAEAWLEAAAEVYSSILDACDAPGSTAALSAIWQSGFVGAGESPIVRHLVSMLKVRWGPWRAAVLGRSKHIQA